MKYVSLCTLAISLLCVGACTAQPAMQPTVTADLSTTVGVIGDYGANTVEAAQVATTLLHMKPDSIVTVGDNTYGDADSYNANVGSLYGSYIQSAADVPVADARTNAVNAFYATLGNHDWDAGLQAYTDYFTLPHNERYYTITQGAMQFFVLSSDPREPDGVTSDSVQAKWFYTELAASQAPWKIVVMHHPAYTSPSVHSSTKHMRWDFTGVDLVLQGHNHLYERLLVKDLPYVTVGNSGNKLYAIQGGTLPESLVARTDVYGFAMLTATNHELQLQAITKDAEVIDSFVLEK